MAASELQPELQATDRLLEIWGKDGRQGRGGSMHPLEALRLIHDGVVLGAEMTNDKVMIVVEETVLHSPVDVRAFLFEWYRRPPRPSHIVAKNLGISRTQLYEFRKQKVSYVRGALNSRGLRV
jgi:hypothetical protein